MVRIGPYICGEYYFGGLPLWLRHVNNIQCFRCMDPIWKLELEKWLTHVIKKLQPKFVTSQNTKGPIIWMQIENEYEEDDDYLEWTVAMARNVTTDIPWGLCGHNIPQCNQVNRNKENDIDNKVVCTINGFWMDDTEGSKGGQPGRQFFQKLWSHPTGNPTQPAIWTEDQGWFDIWGMANRVRWTSDQVYGMARFFAYGGSYVSFVLSFSFLFFWSPVSNETHSPQVIPSSTAAFIAAQLLHANRWQQLWSTCRTGCNNSICTRYCY